MTKAGIIAVAKNIELMDMFNVLSGLLEIEGPENKAEIDSLVDNIYKGCKALEKENEGPKSKRVMLQLIAEKNPELADKLMKARYLEVLFEYNKLTNKN